MTKRTMKLFYKISAAVLGMAAGIALVQPQIAVGLSDREVGEVAQEITVRIDGPDKAKGSGAIVGKRDNSYTVLTNCHVIETPGTYTIQTHTGTRYTINSNQGICQPGIDLAVLRFTSTRRYRVANLGNSSQLAVGYKVYASGWIGLSKYNPERGYRFRSGNITGIDPQAREGYTLVYTNNTGPGMSGGPILDDRGDVVGINGRGIQDPNTGQWEFLGIAINTYKSWELAVLPPEERSTPPQRPQLSPAEINAIARQTTVAIAPGLTPKLAKEFDNNRNNPLARPNDSDGVWNPTSGVIIAREGRTYYVLTVSHSFKQRHLESNLSYGIRTSDGRVHVVNIINDGRGCPLGGNPRSRGKLIRFGCYSINVPGRVRGVDLAVVSFDSNRDYMVASLGNNDDLNIKDNVYISGWPDPEKEKDPRTGKCRGRVARRQWRLVSSTVVAKIENLGETEFGYSIFYLDKTKPGIGGGPVFDAHGRVVSIHGRGSVDKQKLVSQYCAVPENRLSTELQSEDIENILAEAAESPPINLSQRFSSGQSMNVFLSLLAWTGINLPLRR